jgi:hypothetical protein
MRVLALVAAGADGSSDLAEFLRVVVGLRACGHETTLAEMGAGVGTLGPEARLPAEAERYLDALEAEDVRPVRSPDVSSLVARADAIVLLPDASRSGVPALLRLRRGVEPAPEDLAALLEAGQVCLE